MRAAFATQTANFLEQEYNVQKCPNISGISFVDGCVILYNCAAEIQIHITNYFKNELMTFKKLFQMYVTLPSFYNHRKCANYETSAILQRFHILYIYYIALMCPLSLYARGTYP